MHRLEWTSEGIGYLSIVFGMLLMYVFRRKIFGYFDPLAVYLILRAGPMLGSIFMLFSIESLSTYYYSITVLSTVLFFGALYFFTPKIKYESQPIEDSGLADIYRVALALTVIKFIILYLAAGTLPVFGDSGSDSFIGFEDENKIGTSFLFSIGAAELILLSLLLPVTKGLKRIIVSFLLIVSLLMIISAGKKSSMLLVLTALAFGDYLRINFTGNKKQLFTSWKLVLILIVAAFLWAGLQYRNTAGDVNIPDAGVISFVLDFIFVQWAYPVFLFASGELNDFFAGYVVNKLTYFFHTALSPLGFPAFSASIGPALNEYQTGLMTGNGINPLFLLEGYALFGVMLPLYAIGAAFFVGRFRCYIANIRNQRNKVLLYTLLLPPLYIFPVDALLFMKIIIALIILSPGIVLIAKGFKR